MVHRTDIFLKNFLINLIDENVFFEKDIAIYFFGNRVDECKDDNFFGDIEVNVYNGIDIGIRNALSVNFISCSHINSNIIKGFIESSYIDTNKIVCILTDDELVRWHLLYCEKGELLENKKHKITSDVAWCVKRIKNFVAPGDPWFSMLKKIVDNDVRIIKVAPLFSILPLNLQKKLFKEKSQNLIIKKNESNIVSVLLFTKPKHPKILFIYLKGVLQAMFAIKRKSSQVVISIWAPFFIYRCLVYFLNFIICGWGVIFGHNISLKVVRKMPAEEYFLALLGYDYLIPQERGGGVALREFLKYSGQVLFYEDSLNNSTYQQFYQCSLESCQTHQSIFEYILLNGKGMGNDKCAMKILDKQRFSFSAYKKLYASFE
jgi:hypothetical protein